MQLTNDEVRGQGKYTEYNFVIFKDQEALEVVKK
jgi:hypothetical protein